MSCVLNVSHSFNLIQTTFRVLCCKVCAFPSLRCRIAFTPVLRVGVNCLFIKMVTNDDVAWSERI